MSRLRQETETRTSEAQGIFNGELPLESSLPLSSYLIIYGSTYSTSSAPLSILSNLGGVTNLLDGYAVVGLHTNPTTNNSDLRVGLGLARQNQLLTSSYGPIFQGAFLLSPTVISEGQVLDIALNADERRYTQFEQHLRTDNGLMRLQSYLPFDGKNTVSLSGALQERDFLLRKDSSQSILKQERNEMSLLFSDSLAYALLANDVLSVLQVSIEPRAVTRRTPGAFDRGFLAASSPAASLYAPSSINSLRLAFDGRMFYAPQDWLPILYSSVTPGFSFDARYEEKNENVTLISQELTGVDQLTSRKISDILDQESYASGLTQMNIGVGVPLSEHDMIGATGSARLYRYDTPNQENHDDRDELLTGLSFTYSRVFSEQLHSELALKMTRSHLVYLASDRSAQNNVTRSIALSSLTEYHTSGFDELLRSEVFANYTLLDYYSMLPLLQDGSYLLRGLNIHDSTTIQLGLRIDSSPLELIGDFDLRLTERGSYNDSNFSERRSALTIEGAGELLLGMRPAVLPLELRIGFRGFRSAINGFDVLSTTSNWHVLEDNLRVGPVLTVNLWQHYLQPMTTRVSGWMWYASVVSTAGTISTYNHQIESGLSLSIPL